MKATISCGILLAIIVIFVLMIVFQRSTSGSSMLWYIAGFILLAILIVGGFVCSIMAVVQEKSLLSWICLVVFSAIMVFVIQLLLKGLR